jgi:uncharacterized protein (DUF305 family)
MSSLARRAATASVAAVLSTAAVVSAVAIGGTMVATAATVADPPATVTAQQLPGGATPVLNLAQHYATDLHGLSGAQLEEAFLAGMIPHHAAAVSMAQLELARGTQPELKAMAQQIISGQRQEITEMTNWLHDWYGLTPAQAEAREPAAMRQLTAEMAAGMATMNTRLAAVPAGPAFDKAFLTAMIPHHEMAVIVSRPVTTQAVHPELRSLAQQIITAQSAEVGQMTTWLRDWYGATTSVRP